MAMNRTRACHPVPPHSRWRWGIVRDTGTTQIPSTSRRPPRRASFDARLVERGAELAAAGNCRGCHTPPGARAFSGGLPLKSPFGTIYTSNITPDAETGIGRWSEEAFRRAMHEGIGRNGEHLYPAFPYDHYTLVTDADDRALYAYLMTRPAVQQAGRRPTSSSFPFNVRESIGVWKKLYFHPGVFQPDPAHDACGTAASTSPTASAIAARATRRATPPQAERRDHYMDGGESEGWHAYAINERSAAPTAWTVEGMQRIPPHRGWTADHGVSRGPWPTSRTSWAKASDADVARDLGLRRVADGR